MGKERMVKVAVASLRAENYANSRSPIHTLNAKGKKIGVFIVGPVRQVTVIEEGVTRQALRFRGRLNRESTRVTYLVDEIYFRTQEDYEEMCGQQQITGCVVDNARYNKYHDRSAYDQPRPSDSTCTSRTVPAEAFDLNRHRPTVG